MTDGRPFRFAVQATRAASGREWHDTARLAEQLGYSTLFSADHYMDRGPAAQQLAPIASLASAAAVTNTLRIGCRVFCIDYHVPAAFAKETATLDFLSDGRLELGIGAGWSEDEYQAMGLVFDAPGRRIDKLEEVIALLKAHWSGEELACKGEFVNVNGYVGLPLPVQRPHPLIMIGGARKRVLSLAAREADIVSIANVPFDPVNEAGRTPQEEAVHRLGFVRDAAGDRFAALDIESSPFFSKITDRAEDTLTKVAAMVDADTEILRDHPNVLIGSRDEIVERLQSRREKFGINYVSVQQVQMERFAPIVDMLRGR